MGDRRALLIATERYLDDSLPQLRSPVQDARKLAALLEDPDIGQFDSVQVLVDESKEVIEAAVERLFQDRGVDLALVYLSCHGLKDGRGRLHFATVRTVRETVRSSAVSAEFIKESMEYSRARQKIALLDCCFSGAFGKSKGGADADDIPRQFVDHRGSYVITAADSVQEALEDEIPGGGPAEWSSVFTRAVIEGLSTGRADLDEDGWVTAQELYQYVADTVARTHEQKPTFFGSDIQGGTRLRLSKASPHAHRPFHGLTESGGPSAPATVDQLLPPLAVTPDRGLAAVEWRENGRLIAPVGRSHRTEGRRVQTHYVDLSGGAGHVAVAGGPRSGKTLLLQTLVTSLALTHTPHEVEFHCIDFGGGGLHRLKHLPHVRGLARRQDPDGVHRMVAQAVALNTRRENDFQRLPAIDSIEAYRGARARGRLTDQPVADLFLLVDGWPEFAENFQDLAVALRGVAATGLRHGVHLMVSTSRWSALPRPLLDVMLTRFELALSSPDESLVHPELAAQLTPATPGVALCSDRAEKRYVHIALPRTDGAATVHDLASAAAELGARVRGGWAPHATDAPAAAAAAPWEELSFADLLEIGDPGAFTASRFWGRRAPGDRLRVPIGIGQDGRPAFLDLKEAALGGMGPHGLCVGATGSGKSELLRTLVLALAATHSSEQLNFVLADFKGGATFAGMAELPHVAAVITNLADDRTLIGRMRDALSGELQRRQEVLRAAGNYPNVYEYERARATGLPLEPLPSLVVIVDEFSELLSYEPDFIEMFIQIGRIGRSLGVHMLLASQRLEEGRLRGLETYLSYRIGLRTFSAAESRAAMGVPDAYHLPSTPGAALLRYDGDAVLRFKSAYVSAPYRPPTARRGAGDAADDPLADTVLDVLVGRMAGQGPPAHQVWLPPLDEPPTLDQLLPAASSERGLQAAPSSWAGRLAVPVALCDKPFEQRRELMPLDFSGAAGHGLVVGGPQSGKSTALRTLIAAFALTHTPREVQFYAVDLGGGGLADLAGLPHVGGVASRLDPDRVRRTVAEVGGLLDHREEFFRAHALDSIATYRQRRAAGEFAEEPWGDVFLVIDGLASFRADFDPLEPALLDIAGRGLAFGVHLVVSANRYGEVRPALRDLLLNRVELRLGDPIESEIDRRQAHNVPADRPGRGLSPDRTHFLTALPRIDGVSESDNLGPALGALVASVREHWAGPAAPPVRMLPAVFPAGDLPAPAAERRAAVPFAIDEATLSPLRIDFETDPLLVVYGEAESGKSSLLRLLARQITERSTPQEAVLLVGDYRRALLGAVPEGHLVAHCSSGPQLAESVRSLTEVLGERMPGPDVTAEQLRNRSWYDQPDVFVLVDDYDLVTAAAGNPLLPLVEYLPFARDLGLRLVLARSTSGAGRALFEPVLQRVLEMGAQALLFSGEPAEGPLAGPHRPMRLPPGRARFVTRRRDAQLVQTAWLPEV
ncbi:type VII secretion protein EccCb [Streptomyces sp. RS10V-4]|uniref:type VII secretion protein EccCb n=1 Tax=Streptomyces rhizoryzae TaxID=2932493 RepID=UPI002003E16D|nr:type VII secretion protein EccCb [Streptomyces rhizoryzae]MCK7625216.1 type VII secretion protein EccCb [Streptomyces rhizoryzae]